MSRKIILICSDCLSRNYHITKNQHSTKRMEIKKFCAHCNKHTIHKESR